MFNQLIDNYKRKIKIPYFDADGKQKDVNVNIKPLSINDLMYIVDDEACGYLLMKVIDGIDIERDPEEAKMFFKTMSLNSDYALLFFAVIACCISFEAEDGSYISLKRNPEQVEYLPFDIQLDIFNHILELSMPVDLKKFSNNVKKFQTRMFKQ